MTKLVRQRKALTSLVVGSLDQYQGLVTLAPESENQTITIAGY